MAYLAVCCGMNVTYHSLSPNNAKLLEGSDVFDNPVDAQQLAAFVADPGHLMVFAKADDDVVGFASGTIILHPDKRPTLFINEVGVNEAHRRRGIAQETKGVVVYDWGGVVDD